MKVNSIRIIAGFVITQIIFIAGHDGMCRYSFFGKGQVIASFEEQNGIAGFGYDADAFFFQSLRKHFREGGVIAACKENRGRTVLGNAQHFEIEHGANTAGFYFGSQLVGSIQPQFLSAKRNKKQR